MACFEGNFLQLLVLTQCLYSDRLATTLDIASMSSREAERNQEATVYLVSLMLLRGKQHSHFSCTFKH